MRHHHIVVAAVLVSACGAANPERGVTTVRDSGGVQIVENSLPVPEQVCRLAEAPEVLVGSAEDTAEPVALFGVYDAATLSDGAIAIANSGTHEIRIFSRSGSFERAIGREGPGPGEFRKLFMLWSTPGDTIVAGDYRPWRFTYFTRQGQLIRTVEPRPRYGNAPQAADILSNGEFILAARVFSSAPATGYVHDHQVVAHHHASGEVLDTIGTYSIGRHGQLGPPKERFFARPIFEPVSQVAAGGDAVFVAPGIEREVARLAPSGRPVQFIRWTGPGLEASRSEVSLYKRQLIENATTPAGRETAELLLDEKRPANDRFPAVANLMVGTDGTLWVEEFSRPSYIGVRRWLSFDARGAFRCVVHTPPGLEPFEFSARHLLGGTRDSLDIEYVASYPLSGPESK